MKGGGRYEDLRREEEADIQIELPSTNASSSSAAATTRGGRSSIAAAVGGGGGRSGLRIGGGDTAASASQGVDGTAPLTNSSTSNTRRTRGRIQQQGRRASNAARTRRAVESIEEGGGDDRTQSNSSNDEDDEEEKGEESCLERGEEEGQDGVIIETYPKQDLWSRFFTIMISGTGFFADSYDLFVINIVLLMMKQNPSYGELTVDLQSHVSLMAIIGALVGQILFGIIGDQYGRRNTFIVTASLTILGTLLQACATAKPVLGLSIWGQMMIYRFILGLGVGGEYPAASTITSENSNAGERGRNLAAVFCMQGLGRAFCALMLLFAAYVIEDTEWQWRQVGRFSLLIGALPMMAAIFFRWLPETDAFRTQVENVYPNMCDRFHNIFRHVWENKRLLVGTAGSWFILDVLFYGNSLFSADMTEAMGESDHNLQVRTIHNLIIQLMALPGYILAVIFMDCFGRKRLQLFGFLGEGLVFGAMVLYQNQLKLVPVLFVFIYGLSFLFDNFGPNTTTFVIPAEVFPTEARSTCHGLSAAMGKLGAVIGASAFLRLAHMHCSNRYCDKDADPALIQKGLQTVFFWCAFLALLGFLWTCFLVQDKPHKSLELIGRQQRVREGEANATA